MIAGPHTLVYLMLVVLVGLNGLTIFYIFKWLSSLNIKIHETDSAIATLFQRLNDQIVEVVESSGLSEPPNPIQAIFAQFMADAMNKNKGVNNRNALGHFVGAENGKEIKNTETD